MDYVAVFDDVVFAFQAELTCFFALDLAAVSDEIIIGDHLRPNKTTLDIAMDFPGGLSSDRSLGDRPRPHFVFARSKETDQVQERVSDANEAVARRFPDADFFEECHSVAFIELSDFHFHFTGQSESRQSASLQFFL